MLPRHPLCRRPPVEVVHGRSSGRRGVVRAHRRAAGGAVPPRRRDHRRAGGRLVSGGVPGQALGRPPPLYRGTLKIDHLDEAAHVAAHVATMAANGQDKRGQGRSEGDDRLHPARGGRGDPGRGRHRLRNHGPPRPLRPPRDDPGCREPAPARLRGVPAGGAGLLAGVAAGGGRPVRGRRSRRGGPVPAACAAAARLPGRRHRQSAASGCCSRSSRSGCGARSRAAARDPSRRPRSHQPHNFSGDPPLNAL